MCNLLKLECNFAPLFYDIMFQNPVILLQASGLYLFITAFVHCNFVHFVIFQDGLRRRMDKLKNSIEEANQAVDKEREKNVSLLHLIFPPDIAKRLWLG